MNEEDFAKTDEIAGYLEERFPDFELERDRNVGRGLSAFYLNINMRGRMILKITDECIMDNDLVDILNAIDRRCIPTMQASLNQEVVLYNDLQIEKREPQ